MEASEALALITRIHQSGRALYEPGRTVLAELEEDLRDGRTVVLTQEELHDLRMLCRRVGVTWEAGWSPEAE